MAVSAGHPPTSKNGGVPDLKDRFDQALGQNGYRSSQTEDRSWSYG